MKRWSSSLPITLGFSSAGVIVTSDTGLTLREA
jgi:hypothetical protein